MQETPTDHVLMGFKTVSDGWHVAKFQSGIDYLPAGKDKEGLWQDDKGNKALKLPCLVDDVDDPDHEGQINIVINTGSGQKSMAGILLCVGLWDAVQKRYPGKDVTVFDAPVIEGIKVKLPGTYCMIKTEVDRNNNARPREIVSFAKYKEIEAEEKTKAAGKGKAGGKKAEVTETPVADTKEW